MQEIHLSEDLFLALSQRFELEECLKIAAATAAAKVEDRFELEQNKWVSKRSLHRRNKDYGGNLMAEFFRSERKFESIY